RDHCPVSVATSFQLGSREVTSRANVHTSVTSVTLSGLPSLTAPFLSRVTDTNCDTKRIVTCAILPRSSAPMMSVESMETKRRSGRLAGTRAPRNDRLEAVVDIARQQIFQGAAVAIRVGGDDHLIGRPRPAKEMLGLESLVLGRDRIQAPGDRGVRLRNSLPAIGRSGVLRGFCGSFRWATARKRDNLVVASRTRALARRVGVVRRSLTPRALAQDAAQSQKDEHCECQEDDGVDVKHVLHAARSGLC